MLDIIIITTTTSNSTSTIAVKSVLIEDLELKKVPRVTRKAAAARRVE